MNMDFTNRRFEIWAYSVSMSRLLLRSPRDVSLTSRVDLLFQGVTYLRARTRIDGFVLRIAPEDEKRVLLETLGLTEPDLNLYLLEGEGPVSAILASYFEHSEDNGEFDEPNAFYPFQGSL